MRILKTSLLGAGLLGLALTAAAQSTSRPAALMVGDNAPELAVAKWVKGNPVESLAKGNIYVVEFWATWCGPCKVSIPHLTELQKKFADKATFIGVSSFEDNWNGVEPFVQTMGEKMNYTVAMDKTDKPSDRAGYMAKAWMIAAKQPGIPTAFIIDKDQKVAWIGHPMNLEEPLSKVIDGSWDRDAFAQKYASDMEKQAKVDEGRKAYGKALKAKDWTGAIQAADQIEKLDSKYAPMAANMRWNVYVTSDNAAKVSAYGDQLVSNEYKNDAQMLNSLAWSIVDPKTKLTKRDTKLALRAAGRAVELTQRKEPAMLDTLAWAYYWSGDKKKAIAIETAALNMAKDPKTDYENALKTFQGG